MARGKPERTGASVKGPMYAAEVPLGEGVIEDMFQRAATRMLTTVVPLKVEVTEAQEIVDSYNRVRKANEELEVDSREEGV